MTRKLHSSLLAALAAAGLCIPGQAQGSGVPYRDPKGRFSLQVPSGWTATPMGDAVELKRGNAQATLMVSDGPQDPKNLLLNLGGQMASQWRNFQDQKQIMPTTMGGLQGGAYSIFSGTNPRGVDSLMKIVTATDGRYSFALMMSCPVPEFGTTKAGFDAIELGLTIAGSRSGAAPVPQTPPSPQVPPRPPSPAPVGRPVPQSNGMLPDRRVPDGFTLSRDPQGTGRTLMGSFSGNARSATVVAQGLLAQFAGYFDQAPSIATAAASDSGRKVQALFSTTMQGVPVMGVIGVELSGGNGTVAVLYDRAVSFRDSYGRMLAQGGGGGRPSIQPLHPVGLADGSNISIPQGWRVVASNKGGVDLAGPNGELISLGAAAPVYTQAPNYPGMPANYVLHGPCCDPVRAMMALTPQLSALAQRAGQPSMQFVRAIDAKATPAPGNGGQAAFIFSDMALNGRPAQQFSWVAAIPTGYGQWMYYISMVTAPTEVFAREAQTMLAIWNSYSINPAVFRERMDTAIRNMNQAAASVLAAGREASRVREAANEGWDQVIRGVYTVESSSGNRYQVDNRVAQGLVDHLNQTDNERWRVVPMDDLAPRR